MADKEQKISPSMIKLMRNRKEFLSRFLEDLENFSAEETLQYWQEYVCPHYDKPSTKDASMLLEQNIVPKTFATGEVFTIGALRCIKPQTTLDYIKTKNLTELEKNNFSECYSLFIDWLNEISFGWFDQGQDRMSRQAADEPLNLSFSDWRTFIDVLYNTNERDALIALALLQGEQRISQVLKLTKKQINLGENTINYSPNKQIKYEAKFMRELQSYIESTEKIRGDNQIIFLTRTGKPVTRLRINYSFAHVSKKIGIKNVTPDSLRNIYKMFIQQKYSASAIMQIRKNTKY